MVNEDNRSKFSQGQPDVDGSKSSRDVKIVTHVPFCHRHNGAHFYTGPSPKEASSAELDSMERAKRYFSAPDDTTVTNDNENDRDVEPCALHRDDAKRPATSGSVSAPGPAADADRPMELYWRSETARQEGRHPADSGAEADGSEERDTTGWLDDVLGRPGPGAGGIDGIGVTVETDPRPTITLYEKKEAANDHANKKKDDDDDDDDDDDNASAVCAATDAGQSATPGARANGGAATSASGEETESAGSIVCTGQAAEDLLRSWRRATLDAFGRLTGSCTPRGTRFDLFDGRGGTPLEQICKAEAEEHPDRKPPPCPPEERDGSPSSETLASLPPRPHRYHSDDSDLDAVTLSPEGSQRGRATAVGRRCVRYVVEAQDEDLQTAPSSTTDDDDDDDGDGGQECSATSVGKKPLIEATAVKVCDCLLNTFTEEVSSGQVAREAKFPGSGYGSEVRLPLEASGKRCDCATHCDERDHAMPKPRLFAARTGGKVKSKPRNRKVKRPRRKLVQDRIKEKGQGSNPRGRRREAKPWASGEERQEFEFNATDVHGEELTVSDPQDTDYGRDLKTEAASRGLAAEQKVNVEEAKLSGVAKAQLAVGGAFGCVGGFMDNRYAEPFGLILGVALLTLQVLDHERILSLSWNNTAHKHSTHPNLSDSSSPHKNREQEATGISEEMLRFLSENFYITSGFAGGYFTGQILSDITSDVLRDNDDK